MIFVIPVKRSTNWANKPTGSWSLLVPSSQFNRTSNIWLSYIHSRLKLLQIQNSHLNLLTVNFLGIQKWTEENLRRFLVLEVDETLPWIIWLFEENLVVIFNQLKFACYADKAYCCFFKSTRIFLNWHVSKDVSKFVWKPFKTTEVEMCRWNIFFSMIVNIGKPYMWTDRGFLTNNNESDYCSYEHFLRSSGNKAWEKVRPVVIYNLTLLKFFLLAFC